MMLLSWSLATILSFNTTDEPPSELVRIEQARSALMTGEVEWIWSRINKPDGPWNYTSRFGGEDNLMADHGNEMGVRARRADGTPITTEPYYALVNGRESWRHDEGSLSADLCKHKDGNGILPNMRSLGLSYAFSLSDPQKTLWPLASAQKFTTRTEGDLKVVSAETDHGKVTWWLDPAKDGLPVRVRLEENGKITNESRSALKQFGSVWYPESVQFFKQGYKDGKEPYEVVRVLEAAFNQPDMPSQIRPEDIGIDEGMNVTVRDEQNRVELDGKWDGQAVVSDENFAERYRKGELKIGPMFQYVCAQLKAKEATRLAGQGAPAAGSPNSTADPNAAAPETRVESEWEKHTRLFIAKYQLAKEQEEQALKVLRNCQDKARDYIARRKDKFAELAKREADTTSADLKERAEMRAQLVTERRKLLEPVQQIFEKNLKPGLEKIPTRAQRAKAEEKDTKKP